ncbi:MAG: hypothetical protein ACFFAQ_01980 [Promethearchaeota archaeon]
MYGKKDGKKLKIVDIGQILNILQTNWDRVELTGDQIPCFLSRLTYNTECKVYASGYQGPDYRNYDSEYGCPITAGIRVARKSKGIPSGIMWKFDDYTVFRNNATGLQFLVAGPYKHPTEHHIGDLPDDYKSIEIFEFNYPNCPRCGFKLNREYHCCDKCGWNKKNPNLSQVE